MRYYKNLWRKKIIKSVNYKRNWIKILALWEWEEEKIHDTLKENNTLGDNWKKKKEGIAELKKEIKDLRRELKKLNKVKNTQAPLQKDRSLPHQPTHHWQQMCHQQCILKFYFVHTFAILIDEYLLKRPRPLTPRSTISSPLPHISPQQNPQQYLLLCLCRWNDSQH